MTDYSTFSTEELNAVLDSYTVESRTVQAEILRRESINRALRTLIDAAEANSAAAGGSSADMMAAVTTAVEVFDRVDREKAEAKEAAIDAEIEAYENSRYPDVDTFGVEA